MDLSHRSRLIATFCGQCDCGCPELYLDERADEDRRVVITDDFGARIQMSLDHCTCWYRTSRTACWTNCSHRPECVVDAPAPMLWALSAIFLLAAVPCTYRLVAAHPGSVLRCRANRVDEVAELLMCLGMLAMVSPLGGPIPLAGWRAVFGLAAIALGALWVLRRHTPDSGSCAPSRCGHHAVMAAVMVYMLAGMAQHGGHAADPWLTLAGTAQYGGHGGSPGLGPLAVIVLVYCASDLVLCAVRLVRAPAEPPPVLFGARTRDGTRAVMSAAMGGMVLSMA